MFKLLFFFALLALALAVPKPGPLPGPVAQPNPQFYAVPAYSTYAAYPYAYGWGGLVY
ncbi:neuropeptide-like 4 [Tribolium madens]|uniref:neuropeptide-like 4 n=1 Tax=Tribolium madens TaxID=41895 RepID=UPI001CF7457D|nr:neuropeptide-like 4 [Tribolium madens]